MYKGGAKVEPALLFGLFGILLHDHLQISSFSPPANHITEQVDRKCKTCYHGTNAQKNGKMKNKVEKNER
jgi:hypothetical protein